MNVQKVVQLLLTMFNSSEMVSNKAAYIHMQAAFSCKTKLETSIVIKKFPNSAKNAEIQFIVVMTIG